MYTLSHDDPHHNLHEVFALLYQLSGDYGIRNEDERIQWVMKQLLPFF